MECRKQPFSPPVISLNNGEKKVADESLVRARKTFFFPVFLDFTPYLSRTPF